MTGQRPTTSLTRKLDNTSLTPPKRIFSGISDELNQVILKGMALEAKDRPQSMQAWLAMLEAPKAMPPPPVEPVHKREVVRPKAQPNSEAIPSKPATKSPRIIPWGRLVSVLLIYLLTGYLLAGNSASAQYIVFGSMTVGAASVAGAVGAASVAGALAWGVAWVGAIFVTFAIADVTWAGIIGGIAVAVGGAMAMGEAGDKLRKSFNKVHAFAILASTSNLGLALGSLGHRIFNTGS